MLLRLLHCSPDKVAKQKGAKCWVSSLWCRSERALVSLSSHCAANNTTHNQTNKMFPLWSGYLDVTITESLCIELTKGKRDTLHFSSAKQTDTVARWHQRLPWLLPDRFDARKATRLCCHTRNTRISINSLSASSTWPSWLWRLLQKARDTCLSKSERPDEPAENFCSEYLLRWTYSKRLNDWFNYPSGL